MLNKLFLIIFGMFLLVTGLVSGALIDNLVGYWTVDEKTGSNIGSSVNSNLNFTIASGQTTLNVSGKINTSGQWNNVDGNVSTTDLLPISENYTINFWINRTANAFCGNSATIGYFCTILGSGTIAVSGFFFGITVDGVTADSSCMGAYIMTNPAHPSNCISPTLNQWEMITIVSKKADNKIYYYRNGTNITSSAWANVTSLSGATHLGTRIGAEDITAARLDEVGYWNRALSSAEITELYNNGTGLSYPFSSSDSCTYSGSGIWSITGSDNCSLVTTIGDASRMSINGSGTTTISSVNVTKFNPVSIIGHTLRIIGGLLRVN